LARLEAARAQLSQVEQSRDQQRARFDETVAKENSLKAEIESLRQSENDLLKKIVEIEARLVDQRKSQQLADAQAKSQLEKEQKLNDELEALNRAEQEILARIAAIKERLPQLEQSKLSLERKLTSTPSRKSNSCRRWAYCASRRTTRSGGSRHSRRKSPTRSNPVTWLNRKRNSTPKRPCTSTPNMKMF
jgi:chromosome segregation ATPase